jgi:molybdopterin-guanine dinucleotide biosynthesis protein A
MGGGDKCLVTLHGRPILMHIVDRVAPQVARLALNANGDPRRFAPFGLEIVSDSVPGFAGPLAGLLAGLDWAARVSPQATHLLTVPADTPFLPRDLGARLAAAVGGPGDSAVAESGGRRHPVVGLWALADRDALYRAVVEEGLRKVGAWPARIGARSVAFDAAEADPFFNINTPDDLGTAERGINP